MEKYIVTTGKTIELAIEAALKQLGMERENVSVEVLKNAKSGFLGIGASPAEVKVTYEVPDEPEAPKTALSSASRSKPKAKPERSNQLACTMAFCSMFPLNLAFTYEKFSRLLCLTYPPR